MFRILLIIFFFGINYSQNTCENNCGEGSLSEYFNDQSVCVCNIECAGYGSACCDFYDECFENPPNLELSDFIGTWTGNITNDQTWAYDNPITIVVNSNGSYSTPYNPGGHLTSSSYPNTQEVLYEPYYNNSNLMLLKFRWVDFYHYSCGSCFTYSTYQIMDYSDGYLTLFYNNGSGPAPQANTLILYNEDFQQTLLGDLNEDGVIDILDIVGTVNIVLGVSEYNENVDLNNDGEINVLDIVQIVGIILGN